MYRHTIIVATALVPLVAQPSFGADRDKIIGTWKLLSYDIEIQSTGKKAPVMGAHPTGYAAFLPNGRIFFVLTGEGRKPATTDQKRAALLSTLVAYTGTYTIKGDQWATQVDVAWDPDWVGTEQVRNFDFDGKYMHVLTPWRVMPDWANKGMTRSVITFERSN